tara:strand:- start:2379 stop:2726 length:348 start_codon:yes stop_codon:yes gene_type:complete
VFVEKGVGVNSSAPFFCSSHDGTIKLRMCFLCVFYVFSNLIVKYFAYIYLILIKFNLMPNITNSHLDDFIHDADRQYEEANYYQITPPREREYKPFRSVTWTYGSISYKILKILT